MSRAFSPFDIRKSFLREHVLIHPLLAMHPERAIGCSSRTIAQQVACQKRVGLSRSSQRGRVPYRLTVIVAWNSPSLSGM
jgi:hypothetical protein